MEYNAKNHDAPRSSSTFWPQEAFDLSAYVKGNPTSVKVSPKGYKGEKVKLVKSGTTDDGLLVYKGSYFDNKIAEKLTAEGRATLTFVFEATYSDGKTAFDEVTVIIDNAGGSDMQLHRVW